MAAIERTAYPRFKRHSSSLELDFVYSPTPEEVEFARAATRGDQHLLTFTVLLKAFERLGYFPHLAAVPSAIVDHVRGRLKLAASIALGCDSDRSLRRHHQTIRRHLDVSYDSMGALRVAREAMQKAAEVMDDPADLINVALEEMVRRRMELPAFSSLDRLARGVRARVNERIFRSLDTSLVAGDRRMLDGPLVGITGEAYAYTMGNPLNGTDPTGLFCLIGKNPDGSCRGSKAAKTALKVTGVVVGAVALTAGIAALTVGTGGLDLGVIGLGALSADALGNTALAAGAVSEGLTYLQEPEDCGSKQNVSCALDRLSLVTGGISLGLGGAGLLGGLSAGLRGWAGIGSGVSGIVSSLFGLFGASGLVPGRASGASGLVQGRALGSGASGRGCPQTQTD